MNSCNVNFIENFWLTNILKLLKLIKFKIRNLPLIINLNINEINEIRRKNEGRKEDLV